jgi:hypothetical protein
MERYLEGNIPGTLDTFSNPYLPPSTLSLQSYHRGEEEEEEEEEEEVGGDGTVPFYLTPSFFLKYITPSHYHPKRDIALRPHFVELMHFRDRHPYVESNFLYLQNFLRRVVGYSPAYRYYGSFQGIQQLFRYMIDYEEITDLQQCSPYFLQHLRKLYFLDPDDVIAFQEERDGGVGWKKKKSVVPKSSDDDLRLYRMYFKQFPVHIQLMDKIAGHKFYTFLLHICQPGQEISEAAFFSVLVQIALQLELYQRLWQFRHNDLHGQNVLIQSAFTEHSAIEYRFQGYSAILRVPIHDQRLATIIDFGRAKFVVGEEQYCSDELSPWGAVGDHCNAPSTVFHQQALRTRTVPPLFDIAYLFCMAEQYIAAMGGMTAYRHFLLTYPTVYSFMYECTRRTDGSSFLDSGMQFLQKIKIVSPTLPREPKRRRLQNHRLIDPQLPTYDSKMILSIIDSLSPHINLIALLTENPIYQALLQEPTTSTSTASSSTLVVEESLMRSLLDDHFQSSRFRNPAREENRKKHQTYQAQVLQQIRKRFHGKLQNPFLETMEERDGNDCYDSFE